MLGLMAILSCQNELLCNDIENATWRHSEIRPMHWQDGSVVSLNIERSVVNDTPICVSLDGDTEYELRLENHELPIMVEMNANAPSEIYMAANGIERVISVEKLANDDTNIERIFEKNTLLEVLTSNNCAPCRNLDAHLHDVMTHGSDPSGTPFVNGPLSLIKHHEIDAESSLIAAERADMLRRTVGNPYAYVDGINEVTGWFDDSTPQEIADLLDTSFHEASMVGLQAHAWKGCAESDTCLDVSFSIHRQDRSWDQMRLHAVVTEKGVDPRSPSVYFDRNNYVSRTGLMIDLEQVDADVIHIDRSISLLGEDDTALYQDIDNLGLTVFVEDKSDCSEILPTRCRILNSISVRLDGQKGQGEPL